MDMPDVTGLDILKNINENNIDVETIVLTGVEDVELAVSAMKLGAVEYLTKPVDNDRLLSLINSVLENRENRKGTTGQAEFAEELNSSLCFSLYLLVFSLVASFLSSMYARLTFTTL